jgi:hypothetical protein
MTETEVLKKAVEKAVKNGWQEGIDILALMDNGMFLFEREHKWFDHSFAKAFWGEETLSVRMFDRSARPDNEQSEGWLQVCIKARQPAWRAHLQQMVLYENPIDYLRKFVEEQA